MGLVGIVPPCLCEPKIFLRVRTFFPWVFQGSEIFSSGYFVGIKFLFVGILWVQNFLRGYFVDPKFFLVSILWGHIFFLVGPNFFHKDISRVTREYM